MDNKYKKICYICGIQGADTVDHVPPKNLFHEKDRDNQLITVPAHLLCNKKYEKDDEYFRDNIVIIASDLSEKAKELFNDKVSRSFQREQSQRYRQKFINEMGTVEIRNKLGQHIKSEAIKAVDVDRINNVILRTCKGIYFNTTGKMLAPDCPMFSNMLSPQGINIRNLLKRDNLLKEVVPNVFEYVIMPKSNEGITFLLFFYEIVWFMVVTDDLAQKQISNPKKLQSYDKLQGIHFSDKTLWRPTGNI